MKPAIPKGTRDFSPIEMVRRNYIFDTIKAVYQRFGFMPIETPAMENLDTLTGKYGDEGDKLIFKILNSGDYIHQGKKQPILKAVEEFLEAIKNDPSILDEQIEIPDVSLEMLGEYRLKNIKVKQLTPLISEKALRYDLTVPFARYVVQHQNEITFPFKRYQIQPVWRADKPQKGRYREFYQCDADVIGSNSLLNEIELIQIISEVFANLNIQVKIKINNRKILSGIAEVIGEQDKIIDITVAIDKLDKIGLDKVNEELRSKGLSESAIARLQPLIELKDSNEGKMNVLKEMLAASEIGLKGLSEMEYIFNYASLLKIENVDFDITLARGLNYYTGAILEVKADEGGFTSSICGGGRYDDLTGIFGLPNVSGVGISFGADRIYDVLNDLNRFPESAVVSTQVLFVNFGLEEEKYCLQLLSKLRAAGVNSEIYPEAAKMKKQMGYADAKGINFVVLVGSDEMNSGLLTVKDMKSGAQQKLRFEELLGKF